MEASGFVPGVTAELAERVDRRGSRSTHRALLHQQNTPLLFDLRAAGVTFGDVLTTAKVLGKFLRGSDSGGSAVVALIVDPSLDSAGETTAAPRNAALAALTGGADVVHDK